LSNLKVVLNLGEFRTFFALPNVEVVVSPKVVQDLSPLPNGTIPHHVRVSWGYSP